MTIQISLCIFRRLMQSVCLSCGLIAVFMSAAHAKSQCGSASWYEMGVMTASGERMNPNAMAAAHRTLPFGTYVRVRNALNGRSVVVKINDRGPFTKGRVIDVTRAVAIKLGMKNRGHAKVCFEKVG